MRELRNMGRLLRAVERDGVSDLPEDLSSGTYRWRSYLYARLFNGGCVSMEDKVVLADLAMSLMPFHRISWSRSALVPLEPDMSREIKETLMRDFKATTRADVAKACLYQIDCLDNGTMYTDDVVMGLVPGLDRFRRKATQK